MIAGRRPMRPIRDTRDEAAATYLRDKAAVWAKSAGKKGLTASECSFAARILRCAAEAIECGFHMEGE
jgi:hypothetical protein